MLRSILALALLAGSAACGDDSGSPPSSGGSPSGGITVSVAMRDFAFTPASVPVPAGAGVTVKLSNSGPAPHTFTVAGGVDETLQAGAGKEVRVTVGSGPLAFYCRFHRDRGMQGTFVTAAGQTPGTAPSDDDPYDY